MQKREGRSFAPPPTPPYRPDLGRTGRKGSTHPGLPGSAPLPSLQTAFTRRAAVFGAVTVAGVSAAALPAKAEAPTHVATLPTSATSAPRLSPEAAALQAELARLSSTYRRACREADAASEATPDVDPPEALFTRAGDAQALFGRLPVKSWAAPGRYWYGDRELVDRLRTDPFRYLDGSPSRGAARRDEIVAAWDQWKAAERAAEDASGYTAAQERFEAAFAAYAEFRDRLVEIRTDDPEVLTVKALAIADLCRSAGRMEGSIAAAIKHGHGVYEDALALSLARDFIGLLGVDHRVSA